MSKGPELIVTAAYGHASVASLALPSTLAPDHWDFWGVWSRVLSYMCGPMTHYPFLTGPPELKEWAVGLQVMPLDPTSPWGGLDLVLIRMCSYVIMVMHSTWLGGCDGNTTASAIWPTLCDALPLYVWEGGR